MAKSKGKKNAKGKNTSKAPPEPLVFNVEKFAIVQAQNNGVTVTPTVVTRSPDKTPQALAAEEAATCGMMRMHIEQNDEGIPEFQIYYINEGVDDPTYQKKCEQRIRKERGIPIGIKKSPVNYEVEDHGLPDIRATKWQKNPLTFPVFLKESINFRNLKNRGYNTRIDTTKTLELGTITTLDSRAGSIPTLNSTWTESTLNASLDNLPSMDADMGTIIPTVDSKAEIRDPLEPRIEIVQTLETLDDTSTLQDLLGDKEKKIEEPMIIKACEEPTQIPETSESTDNSDNKKEDSNKNIESTPKNLSKNIRVSALDIWSSQRILNEFMIYNVTTDVDNPGFNHGIKKATDYDNDEASDESTHVNFEKPEKQPTNILEAYDRSKLENLIQDPFYVTDKLTGREFYLDPSSQTLDSNGYYTLYDSASGETLVVDPPKIVALDPISGKELIIDPRKPVGQYYSVEDHKGVPLAMDTSDQQPYIYTDSVSGAQFIVDNKRVNPFTVIDPRKGTEIRIDPLASDGKPYTDIDSENNVYNITPVVPGQMPLLIQHPLTNEPTVLGGPVMIKDPVTGKMKFQEGPFTMRDPVTGQTVKQTGAILNTDPETGKVTLMTNANYVKDPITGELTMGPSLIYSIGPNGRLIATLPESERDKAVVYARGKKMVWDERLGVFIDKQLSNTVAEHEALVREECADGHAEGKNGLVCKDVKDNDQNIHTSRSIDSILDCIPVRKERKKLKHLVTRQKEQREKDVADLWNRKKCVERKYTRNLLLKKEQVQNLFIKSLIEYFGARLQYYEKEQFAEEVMKRIDEESECVREKLEAKIMRENDKTFDTMLIMMDVEKAVILQFLNMEGTLENTNRKPHKNMIKKNGPFKQINELIVALKNEAMDKFEKTLKEENETMINELDENLKREKKFIQNRINDLYVKICCQKFLIVR